MHLGVVLSGFAQDIDDLAQRVFGVFRPFDDADNRFVAILSALQLVLRNEDVVGQGFILGN